MLDLIVERINLAKTFSLVVVFLVFRSIYYYIREENKIRRLGGRAAKRTTWVPFGLSVIYDAVRHTRSNKSLELWHKIFSHYGNISNPYTVEANCGGQRLIFTADEENIKAILATQFADYGKGKTFHDDWHDFLGDSIFTTDGARWHDSRTLLRPQFIKDRLSDLEVFETHVSVLIPILGGTHDDDTVEASDIFFRYTLDAATHFILGRSVESLQNRQSRFADAFGEVQRVQSIIAKSGPLNGWVPRRSFYAGLKVINEFVHPYIEQTLRLSPEELEKKTKSDTGYTFLHALAAFTRDRRVLRDQIVAVLLAGRDTT
ncbi:hypothetical protein LTR66_005702, partial [Elasticomyces elasticus]